MCGFTLDKLPLPTAPHAGTKVLRKGRVSPKGGRENSSPKQSPKCHGGSRVVTEFTRQSKKTEADLLSMLEAEWAV